MNIRTCILYICFLFRTIVVQSEAVPEDELGDTGTLEATEIAMASMQQQQDGGSSGVNLYTLAGHEAMQL